MFSKSDIYTFYSTFYVELNLILKQIKRTSYVSQMVFPFVFIFFIVILSLETPSFHLFKDEYSCLRFMVELQKSF